VAVTHPASWGEHKKKLLAGALAGQGLSVTFLAEPQAAALHYAAAERVEPGSTIAVYDLGGGTFDAAVVRKGSPGGVGVAGFGLLGRPEGVERLGGVDFDEVVFEHVREGLPGVFEGLDESDPAVLSAVARVRRECTEAKEALSSDVDVSIPVLLPGSRGSVRLHRSEFEGLIRSRVEETVAALRRAVSSAGLAPEDLSAVLLVGGSSRIPLVSQLVSEQLGRPVAVDADPKNAIAKGAALAISPLPTVSWPNARIAPVAPPRIGHVVGADAGASAPAQAPPLHRTSSRGVTRPGSTAFVAGVGEAPRRPPPRPSQASVASLLSNDPRADRSPRNPESDPGWEYQSDPDDGGRPVGLMIGIGGMLTLVAVVVALLIWLPGTNDPNIRSATDSVPIVETSEVTRRPASARSQPEAVTGDSGADSGSQRGDGVTPKPSPSPSPSSSPSLSPSPSSSSSSSSSPSSSSSASSSSSSSSSASPSSSSSSSASPSSSSSASPSSSSSASSSSSSASG
ncbi:MAG: Hsp70 family protein, partial [Pseudonocardia sp.]